MKRKKARPPICCYCGCEMVVSRAPTFRAPPRNRVSVDHIVPQSKIASAHPGADAEWKRLNRIKVCVACNGEKGDMWPLDWLAIMPAYGVEFLSKRLAELGCPPADIAAARQLRAAA